MTIRPNSALRLDAGGFNRAELNAIVKLVHEHRETFLERWYEFFGR